MNPTPIVNIAAYHFATLEDLPELKEQLLPFCQERGIKGTILLAPEGINMFLAGTREIMNELLTEVRSIPGLEQLEVKESESAEQPFRRMLVKIKKEILSFGMEGVDPRNYTSPTISPQELKKWYDEGKSFTILDTRNDYEVRLGTFQGAMIPQIDKFKEFPDAVKKMPEKLKKEPIVMFCTGGIRCEKAGPFMENAGFENIYQLEGGILNYFKECGDAYYDGECFVFDHRVGVDANLNETKTVMCFKCQMPLTEEEQQDPRYQINESCPHCFDRPVKTTTPKPRKSRLLKKGLVVTS